MIVCRDCGHRSADTEQFCASCGAFLEFSGERVADAAPVASAPPVQEDAASELFRRAKRALSVDNDSLAADEATQQRVSDDDAALAAKVVAEREAAVAAAKAEAEAKEAAARLAEEERQRALAQQAAADAQRRLDQLRDAHAADARAREEQLAAAAREEAARREAALADAERQARELVERERAEAAERVAAAQREAEAQRLAAVAAADEARQREERAREEARAATRRLEESTAQAEEAMRRAAQEADALQAAEAARAAAAAEAERARAEAASAAAAAAEEVARARAEAEAARAEAAELRARAQAEQARAQSEREAAEAAARADEQARRARQEAEERLEAERRRAADDAAAAAAKKAADDAAAERRAAEELAEREAEAAAAAVRAEEERARAAAQQEAAKREREEALRKAAALVVSSKEPTGSAPASTSASTTTGSSTPTAPTSPGSNQRSKAAKKGESASSGVDPVVPAPVNPGEEQRRIAPSQATTEPLNVGDVVCPACGTGNGKERAYCRRCAASLADAKPVKLGFFARLTAKRRARKTAVAGTRKGRASAAGVGLADKRARGRVAWWKLNSSLMRIGSLIGVLALFGFGVEPIRAKLHLPNVRQTVLDKIRQNATPVYDPVRPATATASSNAKGSSAGALIDLANNTAWFAAPTASGGVGSSVVVAFDKPFDLARVLMTSGIANSDQPDKGFVSQPRPSELRVTFDDDQANPVTVQVKDTAEPQTLKISRKGVTSVAFEVTGVYPSANGTGKSVAITELEFFQRRKFGDDWETLPAPKITVSSGDPAAALTDDDLTTAWTSASAGDGAGESFSMTFATPTDVGRLRLAPGHGEAEFQSSPRPHEVQLVLTCQGRCEPTKQISFDDKPGYKTFTINATGVTRIDVQVRSVYGTGGGVAFAELQVQRKRPKVQ